MLKVIPKNKNTVRIFETRNPAKIYIEPISRISLKVALLNKINWLLRKLFSSETTDFIIGLYFGYKICCIRAYIKGIRHHNPNVWHKGMLCKNCYLKSKLKEKEEWNECMK